MFKRISAILLVCFMLFATACAVTPADKGNDVDEDNPLAYTTFRIGCGTGDTMNPTFGATVIGDSILERYDELRTKYNLDIIIETVEKEVDKTDIITKRLAIMQDLFDIFQTAPRYGGISSYKKGVLYAMEEIPTIDSESEKWGYKNHLSSTRFSDGRYYGFFPNEWANAPSFEGILQFNTAMLRSLNIQLPPEFKKKKKSNIYLRRLL